MATYYWVGGTGTWNDVSTTNWSLTSGGSGGAGVPNGGDNVIFNSASSSGSYTVTLGTGILVPVRDVTMSGPASGTLSFNGSSVLFQLYGNLTISATGVSTTNWFVYCYGTSQTITTNGVSIQSLRTASATTISLGSALVSAGVTVQAGGTLTTNNYNITTQNINIGSGSAARTFNLGTSIITFTASGNAISLYESSTTTVNFNASSATLIFTNAGIKNVSLGLSSNTIGTMRNTGAGAIFFNPFGMSGTPTITTLENTVTPSAFTFPAGKTLNITNFNVNGTAGNLVTITSTTSGTAATLSKSSGTVSSNYLSVQDSATTGGANWYAGANSTDVSGNTGWIFANAPTGPTSTGVLGFLF
jgi:hypothetical protein